MGLLQDLVLTMHLDLTIKRLWVDLEDWRVSCSAMVSTDAQCLVQKRKVKAGKSLYSSIIVSKHSSPSWQAVLMFLDVLKKIAFL